MVFTHTEGVWLGSGDREVKLGDLPLPLRVIRLRGKYRQVVLCFHGDVWRDEAIRRAAEQAQAGTRPWVCQRCLHYAVCRKCGHPLQWPPGTDLLHDDGQIRHWGVFPVKPPCGNPECPDWRDPTPHQTKPS